MVKFRKKEKSMSRHTPIAIALLIAAASAAIVRSDVLTFLPTDDTFIDYVNPSSANGSYWATIVRNMGPSFKGHGKDIGWELDALVQFDISAIPAYTPIDSATLHLYYFQYWHYPTVGRPYGCFRITDDWDEESVTWNTRPDWASEPTAVTPMPSAFDWVVWDVTTDVQAFVDQEHEDYGWIIHDVGTLESMPASCFYTKEHGEYIPYLEVVTLPMPSMYVGAIDMWYTIQGNRYRVYTNVTVVDVFGAGVEGAAVNIETALPDGGSVNASGSTGADGSVTLPYVSTRVPGTYTSTVVGVTKDGWIYDDGQNAETTESLTVP
jgi:hypothetical protein